MIASPRLIIFVAACLLAGCAAKPPPPLLSLTGRTCSAQPDLARALPVPLDDGKPVTVTFDAGSPCLDTGSSRSVYMAFALPEAPTPFLVSVLSTPIGNGVSSPHLSVLDGNGTPLREIPREDFNFHGTALYVDDRIHSGERYLIVASDPVSTGQQISQIHDYVHTTVLVAGPVFVPSHALGRRQCPASPTLTTARSPSPRRRCRQRTKSG